MPAVPVYPLAGGVRWLRRKKLTDSQRLSMLAGRKKWASGGADQPRSATLGGGNDLRIARRQVAISCDQAP